MKKLASVLGIFTLLFISAQSGAQQIQIRREYASTLLTLTNTLLELQIDKSGHTDCGALVCKNCNVLHTRAAEAVYPFAVSYRITGEKRYLKAAKNAAFWLISQQQANGSWKETPEEWTGTTTDQLLMLLLAFESISDKLSSQEQTTWLNASRKAADYLCEVMKPEFASINYVATTTATLAKAHEITGIQRYADKAKVLARRTISKMDDKGFINGEGGRGVGAKLGIDLGYEMEMSLWGLGLYAKITSDTVVNNRVRNALREHLHFIYPDGSMDNSWGIRSNKWTLYGGATSDGCQALFSLYSNEDERYAGASFKNLEFLRKSITPSGLIGYGPHHMDVLKTVPCIYPTFTKAKNLALAYQLETRETRPHAALPSEKEGWMKYFENLDVVQVRTKNFMATITGYRYKDQMAGAKSKYMFRPNGGAISYLWADGYGALQASSVTEYSRPEPMSFPEAPGVKSLTPRISYTDSSGYFTNLFEFDTRLKANESENGGFKVEAKGELKNRNWINGGVAYSIDYTFADDYIEKKITLTYHDAFPVVTITEPFILEPGTKINQENDSTVLINGAKRRFLFTTTAGTELISGRDLKNYWAPYPALAAFPIELVVNPPDKGFVKIIIYKISIKN